MRDVSLSQQKIGAKTYIEMVGVSPSTLWGDAGGTNRSLQIPSSQEELMGNNQKPEEEANV